MPRDRFDDEDDRYDDRPRRRERDRDREDEYDRPRRRREREEPPANGPATTSLILGILSLLGGITAIPGLIAGFIGLSKAKKLRGAGHGMALTGTLLSAFGLVVLGLTIWGVMWFTGAVGDSRTRKTANLNLKQIGLALHNNEAATGTLSTGVAQSPTGGFGFQPIPASELQTRMGWRVDLLPYMEQSNLYVSLDPSQPWDSPQNRRVADTAVMQYSDPDTKTDPNTRWRSFYGPNTPFDPQRPNRLTITGITDGTSNTIFVAESGEKVTWTRFAEMPFNRGAPPTPSSFGKPGRATFQVLLFDGSVREVRKTISTQTFSNAITHNGGEVIFDPDW